MKLTESLLIALLFFNDGKFETFVSFDSSSHTNFHKVLSVWLWEMKN